jgi:hypothetical protein
MRSWMVAAALVAGSGMLSGTPAFAFGLGETMGAVAVQGTLAGTASRGSAATIGNVRSRVNGAVATHNRALTSAVGASAPTSGGSGATWMGAATKVANSGGEAWATLTSSLGGTSGWRTTESFGGGSPNAWPTAADAWARGGLLPK